MYKLIIHILLVIGQNIYINCYYLLLFYVCSFHDLISIKILDRIGIFPKVIGEFLSLECSEYYYLLEFRKIVHM